MLPYPYPVYPYPVWIATGETFPGDCDPGPTVAALHAGRYNGPRVGTSRGSPRPERWGPPQRPATMAANETPKSPKVKVTTLTPRHQADHRPTTPYRRCGATLRTRRLTTPQQPMPPLARPSALPPPLSPPLPFAPFHYRTLTQFGL